MLSIQSLSKCYADKTVLNSVSLDVKPGSATVLIGPSGAGKSTLLRCMALLEQPTSGIINYDGKAIHFPSSHAVEPPWPDITAVFQQHFLWPHMSLRNNILVPLENRCSTKERECRIDYLIDAFDMSDFIDRFPNEASLGERQRAAIARALALRPSYVLMDEVTASLDVEQVGNLVDQTKILLDSGIGVLLVTHLLGFAKAVLDLNTENRLAFLDDGSIAAHGKGSVLEAEGSERLRQFLQRMKLGE